MPHKLHHLAVVVSDLGRAEQFYVHLLSLPVIRRLDDEAGQPRSIWVDLGHGAFLAIERATRSEPMRVDEAPGFHCLALGIDLADRAAIARTLVEAGVPIERTSPYTLYFRDPDRNLVALSHHPDAVPPDA